MKKLVAVALVLGATNGPAHSWEQYQYQQIPQTSRQGWQEQQSMTGSYYQQIPQTHGNQTACEYRNGQRVCWTE